MRFSLKRELFNTLQYLLFSLCAATVALYQWDELWRNDSAELSGIADSDTTSEWVKNAISHYYPRYLSVFLGLSAARIMVVYVLSRRARDLS